MPFLGHFLLMYVPDYVKKKINKNHNEIQLPDRFCFLVNLVAANENYQISY